MLRQHAPAGPGRDARMLGGVHVCCLARPAQVLEPCTLPSDPTTDRCTFMLPEEVPTPEAARRLSETAHGRRLLQQASSEC